MGDAPKRTRIRPGALKLIRDPLCDACVYVEPDGWCSCLEYTRRKAAEKPPAGLVDGRHDTGHVKPVVEHNRFFCYDQEDGFETHDTLAQAMKDATGRIADYLDWGDGWPEEVTSIVVGEITHVATMTNKRPAEEDSEFSYMCDYEMLP